MNLDASFAAATMEVFTNAPERYDYGYTETVDAEFCQDRTGKPVRKVLMPVSKSQYQRDRYRSGLHFSAANLDELALYVDLPESVSL